MIGVFGHRGTRGLLPENTLAGFRLAQQLALSGVEFDVGMTADGIVVVHHDPRLNPDIARDATGTYVGGNAPLIRDLTYKQLAAYDVGRLRAGSGYASHFPDQRPQDGAHIPTLGEVLAECTLLDLLVEIKNSPGQPEATLAPEKMVEHTLRALGDAKALSKTLLFSFDWRILEVSAKLEPSLRRCCLTDPDTVKQAPLWFGQTRLEAFDPERPGSVPRAVGSSGAVAWAPFHKMLDKAEMAEARRLGLSVIPWTVNDPADIDRMIDLKVDGIISDFPDHVKAALVRSGIQPAPPGFIAALHH